ncbi:hypothetical protein CEXT_206881 [Caerostris extrusa]|uniref:Uncharacterized protein n=1 Tax=Caerostris extrusa TaxID=172846 RepID=A0AAV4Y7Y8_CAEEX|nr:hypothetical protein CEXT_206881 [Caerostris extrusa]
MANKMQVGNPLEWKKAFLSIPIRAGLKAAVNFVHITIWEKHPTESNKDLLKIPTKSATGLEGHKEKNIYRKVIKTVSIT